MSKISDVNEGLGSKFMVCGYICGHMGHYDACGKEEKDHEQVMCAGLF